MNVDAKYRLYVKNINDTSNGTAINSVSSSFPCYIGGGWIVYGNVHDDGKLYKINVKKYIKTKHE